MSKVSDSVDKPLCKRDYIGSEMCDSITTYLQDNVHTTESQTNLWNQDFLDSPAVDVFPYPSHQVNYKQNEEPCSYCHSQ